MAKKKKPGVIRWLTVGTLCYGSWLLANIALIPFFPVLLAIGYWGGEKGRRIVKKFFAVSLRVLFVRIFSSIGVYTVNNLPDLSAFKSSCAQLYVANHRSWMDGLLLIAMIPDVKIAIESAYLEAPLWGSVMRLTGCIPLSRKSATTAFDGVEKIREAVRKGASVVVFPEGTRIAKGRLGGFSSYFFRIACEENISVLPIIIHSDYPFLGPGKENFLTAGRGRLTIRALKPIEPMDGERGEELARRVHKAMALILSELDAEADAEASKIC